MARKHFSRKELELSIQPLADNEKGRGTHLPEGRLAEIRQETMRLVSEGYKQEDVALALGASKSRLSRWCRSEIIECNGPLRFLNFKDRTLPQMMWDRIECSSPGDCWNWSGFVKSNGYGSLNFKGKAYQAHRLVFETLVGNIPDNAQIDHICNNPGCVNPKHLQLVTSTENLMLKNRRGK